LTFLQERISCIKNYPEADASSLQKQIAERNRLSNHSIIMSNGTVEAIYMLAKTFHRSKSYIQAPSFSEYEDACLREKHTITFYNNFDNLHPEEDSIVWLCNPNNPDGKTTNKSTLRHKIKAHPKTTFIIDEAYSELCREDCSLLDSISEYNNLIFIKSFTKAFAIPGLRLGFIATNEQIAKEIAYYQIPWQINSLAIEAGNFIIENYSNLSPSRQKIAGEMDYFLDRLQELPFMQHIPSETNFVLCKLKIGSAVTLKKQLIEKHGILIRTGHNFKGLDNSYFRLALQTKENIDHLIKILNKTLENGTSMALTPATHCRFYT